MAALSLLARTKRHGVLCNLTEHVVQLARLGRLDERPLTLDAFAELPVGDDGAITQWLQDTFEDKNTGYVSAYCGFHPIERVLLRENVNTRRLGEPNFLPNLLAEQSKITSLKDWHVSALHPLDGDEFTAATPSRPGLLMGLPLAAVRGTQNRLCKLGLLPQRLELGTVPLLGALSRYLRDTAYPHAVVACEIGRTETRIYFLAKDGVHTPSPLPYGLLSIEEAAMKELTAPDVATARAQLATPTEELRGHSRRLVRMLTRHLKPAVDYFEMQTGQPIGGIFCAHLPQRLGWLEEALGVAVDLEFLTPDLAQWLPRVGVQPTADLPSPGRSWFQALSLVSQLAPPATHEAKS